MKTPGRVLGLAVAALFGAASLTFADTPMADAQRLYDEAMYVRALEVLDQLARTDATANVHQYRALCFIALGKQEAAERAMAEIVTADPRFVLDADVASPRVIAQFATVRRRMLPPLIRRGFAEATALYREGSTLRAQQRFDEVLRLLDDPTMQGDQSLADLGLVASAFLELTRAQNAPPPTPAVSPTSPSIVPASAPVAPPPVVAGAEPAPPAAPSPVVPSQPPGPMRVTASEPAAFEPAVAMVRPLPKWTPPDPRTAAMTFAGSIALAVDERGRVIGAETKRIIHPAYDPIVLAAARQWVFQPARQHGKPVKTEVTVDIELLPSAR